MSKENKEDGIYINEKTGRIVLKKCPTYEEHTTIDMEWLQEALLLKAHKTPDGLSDEEKRNLPRESVGGTNIGEFMARLETTPPPKRTLLSPNEGW